MQHTIVGRVTRPNENRVQVIDSSLSKLLTQEIVLPDQGFSFQAGDLVVCKLSTNDQVAFVLLSIHVIGD